MREGSGVGLEPDQLYFLQEVEIVGIFPWAFSTRTCGIKYYQAVARAKLGWARASLLPAGGAVGGPLEQRQKTLNGIRLFYNRKHMLIECQ